MSHSTILSKFSFIFAILLATFSITEVSAQSELFPEKEKLTYRISFDGHENAGYAELHAVGKTTFNGREVMELTSRIKTTDFVSAALIRINENRVSFVDPSTGLGIYSKRVVDPGSFPKEYGADLSGDGPALDLLSSVYSLRRMRGVASMNFRDSDRAYSLTLTEGKTERVRSGAGDFETVIAVLESDFFETLGIWEVKVNFTNDARRIPVMVRLRTKMGKMRIVLASIQDGVAVAILSKPMASGDPINSESLNQSVNPFSGDERRSYSLKRADNQLGVLQMTSQPVDATGKKDSLTLSLVFRGGAVADPLFTSGDFFKTRVDAKTLLPEVSEGRLSGALANLAGDLKYDQSKGTLTNNKGETTQISNGTHNLLSFLYAVRAFNLTPSPAPDNPVNDTRVSVALGERHMIFTVRPNKPETISIGGRNRSAQMLVIVTGDATIDALSPRVWISTSSERSIIRFSIGDILVEAL